MTEFGDGTAEFTGVGVLFHVSDDVGSEPGMPFPLSESPEHPISAAVRQLEALWLEGRVEEVESGFLLPWDAVYDLESAESVAMGIPHEVADDLLIELCAVGAIRDPQFHLRAKIKHPDHGIILDAARKGAVLSTEGGDLLVPRVMIPLFEVVDRPVPTPLSDRLKLIGDGSRVAQACGAALDYFLRNQDILTPDSIGLAVDVISPEEIHLRPSLEGEGMDGFDQFSAESGPTKTAYTKREGKKKIRLVLDPEQKKAADTVRARSILRGPDVPRFFNNPEAFVPEEINLGMFSRRVKGLIPRTYTSQPYVRAQAKGRDWFSISTQVELAAELPALGPSVVESGDDADVAEPATTGESADPSSADQVPSISPDEYAELCREVVGTGEPYVLHRGSWVNIDPKVAERHLELWDSVERIDGEMLLPRSKAAYVLDVFSNLDELEYGEATQDLQGAFLDGIPEFDPPAALRATLMHHQLVGYRWMRYLGERNLGGLLADDMGLGKTIQVISLLAHLAEQEKLSPALIVLPSALVENWKKEIKKFCPSIQYVYEHIGTNRERNPKKIASAQVVLTTYQTLLRDQLILGQIDWTVVAADEAQNVKNPTAQSTRVLKAMKADFRLALTGTPVENGLSELWCIVDFVHAGRLGSQKEFRDEFERPIRDAVDDGARKEVAESLQNRLVPHYIRRLKEDVLEGLPKKSQKVDEVQMGSRQQQYYTAVITELRKDETIAIAALQRLIQICSHPEAYRPSGRSIDELIAECPKLQVTVDRVREIAERGEKVLLFTRLKKMQQILQEALEAKLGTHALIVNGELAGARRVAAVERFNERPGFGAMILGPEAAGVGLNITGANHIIHYTRLWNPAKENQATDRAHRIGQIKPVTVYYPLVIGDGFVSVEQRLAELLEEKQDLARNVVWPRSGLDVQGQLHDWLMTGSAA